MEIVIEEGNVAFALTDITRSGDTIVEAPNGHDFST